jgi:hypothetical protein
LLLRIVCPHLFLPPSILILFLLLLFLPYNITRLVSVFSSAWSSVGTIRTQYWANHLLLCFLTSLFSSSLHCSAFFIFHPCAVHYDLYFYISYARCRLPNPPYSSHFLFNRNSYRL